MSPVPQKTRTRKGLLHDELVPEEKREGCRKRFRFDVKPEEADGEVDRALARKPDTCGRNPPISLIDGPFPASFSLLSSFLF